MAHERGFDKLNHRVLTSSGNRPADGTEPPRRPPAGWRAVPATSKLFEEFRNGNETYMTEPTRQPVATGSDPTLGALVNDLTTQVPQLIRSEIRLAQAELTEKGKRAGIGIGMFGGAGIVALYGVGALIATLILLLALAMDAWLAALIVTVVLFAIAGVLALLGKKQVDQATPLAPQMAVEGVKEDIATVKGQRS
jgi:uncharacterized membrane protein YqjE